MSATQSKERPPVDPLEQGPSWTLSPPQDLQCSIVLTSLGSCRPREDTNTARKERRVDRFYQFSPSCSVFLLCVPLKIHVFNVFICQTFGNFPQRAHSHTLPAHLCFQAGNNRLHGHQESLLIHHRRVSTLILSLNSGAFLTKMGQKLSRTESSSNNIRVPAAANECTRYTTQKHLLSFQKQEVAPQTLVLEPSAPPISVLTM